MLTDLLVFHALAASIAQVNKFRLSTGDVVTGVLVRSGLRAAKASHNYLYLIQATPAGAPTPSASSLLQMLYANDCPFFAFCNDCPFRQYCSKSHPSKRESWLRAQAAHVS